MMLKKDSDAPDMDPPAVETVNAEGKSPYMLLCEHASNYIPSRYKGLGLDASSPLGILATNATRLLYGDRRVGGAVQPRRVSP